MAIMTAPQIRNAWNLEQVWADRLRTPVQMYHPGAYIANELIERCVGSEQRLEMEGRIGFPLRFYLCREAPVPLWAAERIEKELGLPAEFLVNQYQRYLLEYEKEFGIPPEIYRPSQSEYFLRPKFPGDYFRWRRTLMLVREAAEKIEAERIIIAANRTQVV